MYAIFLILVLTIAKFFEYKGDFINSGKYYVKGNAYGKGLTMLLKAPVANGEGIEMAIDLVSCLCYPRSEWRKMIT